MLGESGPAQGNDSQSREHLGRLSVHPEAAYTARSPSPSQLPSGPNLLILSSLLHSLLLPPEKTPSRDCRSSASRHVPVPSLSLHSPSSVGGGVSSELPST